MGLDNNNMTCFTIGHSNHDLNDFLQLLNKHQVNCIVDVRSTPYSEYASQYNRESLKTFLKNHHIQYIFMGDELGARHASPKLLFPDGKVDFRKVAQTDNFKKGIARVIEGINKGFIIALMCSEKDPINCHRFVLVSYNLSKNGVSINHILEDAAVINNSKLEEELVERYKTNNLCLFEPTAPLNSFIDKAYEKRNKDIAYSASNE